jgi:hypothetical protein
MKLVLPPPLGLGQPVRQPACRLCWRRFWRYNGLKILLDRKLSQIYNLEHEKEWAAKHAAG